MTPRIQTRSGKRIDLLNPDPAAIGLGDVAYALAHLNRYTGHAGAYSVAQHSVLVCRALRAEGHGPDVQRAGLMHDAHEAIVGDVSSPVKRAMRAILRQGMDEIGPGAHRTLTEIRDPWSALENTWLHAFVARFNLPGAIDDPTWEPVYTMDLRMLRAEARDLLGGEVEPWGVDVEPWPGTIYPGAPEYARAAFLDECRRLGVT